MIRYFKKISYIFLILVIIVMFFNTNIVTADTDFMDQASDFIKSGGSGQSSVSFNSQLKTINNLLLLIGTGVSVCVAAVLGIKFMIGSTDEKAEIKEMLIPFVVGCIILFGAIGIFRVVINVFNQAV